MAWKSSEAGTSVVQDQHVKHCWEAKQDEHGELIVGVSKQRPLKILTRADLLR